MLSVPLIGTEGAKASRRHHNQQWKKRRIGKVHNCKIKRHSIHTNTTNNALIVYCMSRFKVGWANTLKQKSRSETTNNPTQSKQSAAPKQLAPESQAPLLSSNTHREKEARDRLKFKVERPCDCRRGNSRREADGILAQTRFFGLKKYQEKELRTAVVVIDAGKRRG